LENVAQSNPGRVILSRERKYEADFEFKPVEQEEGEDGEKVGKKRLQRKYFTPSEPNWGPKPRATGGKKAKKDSEPAAATTNDK